MHGEELDLLVTHGNVFLRIMSHLHLRLKALLDAALELFDQSLGGLELLLALFKFVAKHDLVVLLLLVVRLGELPQLGLAFGELAPQSLFDFIVSHLCAI